MSSIFKALGSQNSPQRTYFSSRLFLSAAWRKEEQAGCLNVDSCGPTHLATTPVFLLWDYWDQGRAVQLLGFPSSWGTVLRKFSPGTCQIPEVRESIWDLDQLKRNYCYGWETGTWRHPVSTKGAFLSHMCATTFADAKTLPSKGSAKMLLIFRENGVCLPLWGHFGNWWTERQVALATVLTEALGWSYLRN